MKVSRISIFIVDLLSIESFQLVRKITFLLVISIFYSFMSYVLQEVLQRPCRESCLEYYV